MSAVVTQNSSITTSMKKSPRYWSASSSEVRSWTPSKRRYRSTSGILVADVEHDLPRAGGLSPPHREVFQLDEDLALSALIDLQHLRAAERVAEITGDVGALGRPHQLAIGLGEERTHVGADRVLADDERLLVRHLRAV